MSGSYQSLTIPTEKTRFLKRVGVFICRCGKNIAQTVDIRRLVEAATLLPQVVHTEENVYTCSEEGLASIIEKTKRQRLTRVVVAACTPRTHETLFRETLERAGLNKYLFEFVNIREHCSWIHRTDPAGATAKAIDLVAMGVAKAASLQPLEDIFTPIEPVALVVGGGVAGMKAALTLSALGVRVHLVEKGARLGGMANFLHTSPCAQSFEKAVRADERIQVHLSCHLSSVRGYVGNFDVTLTREEGEGNSKSVTFKVGVIVVATGAVPFEPCGLFMWGEDPRVMTSLELEGRLARDDAPRGNTVFLNCAALPVMGKDFCGRICCITSLRQALQVIGSAGGRKVTVIGRNQMVWGEEGEALQRSAMERGVRLIRTDWARPPVVTAAAGGKLELWVQNALTGKLLPIPADSVVLNIPPVPPEDNVSLSRILKVPLGQDGFFKEKHPKLSPIEFSSAGLFVCGSVRFPATAAESVAQGAAVALKAGSLIRAGTIAMEAWAATVNERACNGCGMCARVCPSGAIELQSRHIAAAASPLEQAQPQPAGINEALCKGCGSCAAACPSGAMDQRLFGETQITAMITELARRATARRGDPVVLVFACNWCSYAGADLAGVSRYEMPVAIRIIRVPCSGRVRAEWILLALLGGIDGVLVLGCHPGECHYEEGNYRAARRIETLKETLRLVGMDEQRVRLDWVSASEGGRFTKIVTEMTAVVSSLKKYSAKVTNASS